MSSITNAIHVLNENEIHPAPILHVDDDGLPDGDSWAVVLVTGPDGEVVPVWVSHVRGWAWTGIRPDGSRMDRWEPEAGVSAWVSRRAPSYVAIRGGNPEAEGLAAGVLALRWLVSKVWA